MPASTSRHLLRFAIVCPGAVTSGEPSLVSAKPIVAPYGSWASPLSATAVAAGSSRLDNVRTANGSIYWTENLPNEGGRIALFRAGADLSVSTVTGNGANVRTRVHEYGGAPFVVVGARLVYSQYDDQRLYVAEPNGERRPLTPSGYRYADCSVVPDPRAESDSIVCVREDHTDPARVRNAIVRLSLALGGAGEVLYGDSDFVAYPRVSADGRRLAFIRWNHPNMPWDTTYLSVAELGARGIGALTTIAGGDDEAVLEPQWDADGALYFQSDRTDFWNLYRFASGSVAPLHRAAGEFAAPLWSLGQANYVLLGNGSALARIAQNGVDRLLVISLKTGAARALDLPYVHYAQLARLDAERIVVLAGLPSGPKALIQVEVRSARVGVIRQVADSALAPAAVSIGRPIEFANARGRKGHAFYYPPVNPAFRAPDGTRPPLLTLVHGGPTAQALPDYSPAIQFWTSRGFAVADVNYAGSSGYGRAYRQLLNGAWGIVDVEDVIACVKALISRGEVDPARTAIRGGSAGGYTVLVALSTSSVFRAGADYYGVSDMTALAKDTHKFESRYLDKLIGPLPAAQAIYDERSPLNHLSGFTAPLIVFQGAEDPVVPPSQSERIVQALRERHAPVAYLLFDGEGHGFRRSENVIRSLQAELSFYGQVFNFAPADDLPPLAIENLKAHAAAP
jgi:dipeptidyl aminopeptidase/acylaminoacyl peptidase